MLTIGVKPKNSSDLDVGRRPELKSDEFFCFTPIVHEILRCEHFFTAEKVLHLFGALLAYFGKNPGNFVPLLLRASEALRAGKGTTEMP